MSKSNIKRLRNKGVKLKEKQNLEYSDNVGRQVTIYYEIDTTTKKGIGEYRRVRVSSQCTLSDYEIARNYNGYAV